MLERFFQLSHHQSSVKTEVLAGLTTFLTMAYIMVVNPELLSATGMDKAALTAVTCLIAALATLLMGLIPKVPIALAPGMGLNAYFAFTLVDIQGISWQVGLGMVFIAGLTFLLLSLVGAREKIIAAIPDTLLAAIGAGIGFFLLFIGFQKLMLVTGDPATLVRFAGFSTESLIGLAGLFLSMWLMIRKVRGAILFGILLSTILALLAGKVSWPETFYSLQIDISPVAFQLDIIGALKWSLIGPIFSLLFVDLFDTVGTLVACGREAKLQQKDGSIRSLGRMLQVDAVATSLSGLLGTSPTTSYIESAAGIAEGGRTGLTAVVTALLFLLGLAFIPLLTMVPSYATAPALILVGILMLRQIKLVPIDQYTELFPALLTIGTMMFTYSIATGIAIGFVSWGLLRMLQGRFSEISLIMYLIMGLSLLSLILG